VVQLNQKSNKISGFISVFTAIAGNFFVTVIKFIGFLISGSGVLFSETIHSLADTLNQILLMVGIKKSVKKRTDEFSYGYGKERFVWALISACGIFFIGSVTTIYRGVTSFLHHEEIYISQIIFVILAISFIVESFTLYIALRELRKNNKNLTLKESLREGDPMTIAVIYEDGTAVLGVIIAFISILLFQLTNNFYWDAIGSIIIGVILGFMAIILITKNRNFLIEKSIPEEIKEEIIKLLEAEPSIEKIIDFKSSILDIGKYRIKCEIEFNGSALMKELTRKNFLREEYKLIKDDYEEFLKFCVDYMDRAPRLVGNKINEIEKKIQEAVPEIVHIDIEIN